MKLFNKIALVLVLLSGMGYAAEDNVYYKVGPLELNIPLKTADVVYLYDGIGKTNLVGGETTVATVWQKVSATVGVVTSVEGKGAFFAGADINTGNALDRYVSLGSIRVGAFGGYDSRRGAWMAGPKCSILLW